MFTFDAGYIRVLEASFLRPSNIFPPPGPRELSNSAISSARFDRPLKGRPGVHRDTIRRLEISIKPLSSIRECLARFHRTGNWISCTESNGDRRWIKSTVATYRGLLQERKKISLLLSIYFPVL